MGGVQSAGSLFMTKKIDSLRIRNLLICLKELVALSKPRR